MKQMTLDNNKANNITRALLFALYFGLSFLR